LSLRFIFLFNFLGFWGVKREKFISLNPLKGMCPRPLFPPRCIFFLAIYIYIYIPSLSHSLFFFFLLVLSLFLFLSLQKKILFFFVLVSQRGTRGSKEKKTHNYPHITYIYVFSVLSLFLFLSLQKKFYFFCPGELEGDERFKRNVYII